VEQWWSVTRVIEVHVATPTTRMLSKNTEVIKGSFVSLFNFPGIFCDGPKETVYMKLVTIVASRLRFEIYIFRIRNTSANDPITSSVFGSMRHLVTVCGRILWESDHWTGDWLLVGSQQRSQRCLTTKGRGRVPYEFTNFPREKPLKLKTAPRGWRLGLRLTASFWNKRCSVLLT
jgi:hypothetical protein